MNKTKVDSGPIYAIEDYCPVASLSVGFCLIDTIICILILILIWQTKSRLHRVDHLLICNKYIASIIYSIVPTNNSIFLLFIRCDTSVMSCRWRVYFTYVELLKNILLLINIFLNSKKISIFDQFDLEACRLRVFCNL